MDVPSSHRYNFKHGLMTPQSSTKRERNSWTIRIVKKEDTPTATKRGKGKDKCQSRVPSWRHTSGILTPPHTPTDSPLDLVKPVLLNFTAKPTLIEKEGPLPQTPANISPERVKDHCADDFDVDERSQLDLPVHFDGTNEASEVHSPAASDSESRSSFNYKKDSPFLGSLINNETGETHGHGVPNLRIPDASVSPPSCVTELDDLTPLTEASRARKEYPFPCQGRNDCDLSTLAQRCLSSPLRSSQWSFRGGRTSRPSTPSQRLDRFIPLRQSVPDLRSPFMLTKPIDRLSKEEKTFRRSNVGPDPFSSYSRRSNRFTERLQQIRADHYTSRLGLRNRYPPIHLNSFRGTLLSRNVSPGTVWGVGGPAALSERILETQRREDRLSNGMSTPIYYSRFFDGSDSEGEADTYEQRLALAADVDISGRAVQTSPSKGLRYSVENRETIWVDGEWIKKGSTTRLFLKHLRESFVDEAQLQEKYERRRNPCQWSPSDNTVLDAPQLRDDFYCSLLAYSLTSNCLAVALGNLVHLWNEETGVDTPSALNDSVTSHVTCLSFSSTEGAQSIIAVGRADGRLTLWSTFDEEPRFVAAHPISLSCVSFRPVVDKRVSARDCITITDTEELLVGDERGSIYYYAIEWPNPIDRDLFDWHGNVTLLVRLRFHTQQVCGLSWSPGGDFFASGGNDNACFLFERRNILPKPAGTASAASRRPENNRLSEVMNSSNRQTTSPSRGTALSVDLGRHKHHWMLKAAVKAIAFCPWQSGLVALGGGSNDRCIHFFHTVSGTELAIIDCAAQITSLVWSTTRREIAATFGFAQPEHPYRIAVFSWPSCEQVVAIPWPEESRALYAIAFPRGPDVGNVTDEDRAYGRRTREEGCLVIAASDLAIRFHEVWPEEKSRRKVEKVGLLGGSNILEALHGIDDEAGEVIR